MKRLLPLLLTIPAITAAAALPQTGTGETDGYRLVWQDLFDGETLNPQRWNIEVSGSGNGNNELQYYTDREINVRVGDDGKGNGCLILTACREDYSGRNFTSGRVNSKNLIAFTHGKIEASILLPRTANGLWPAFWMMGNDYDQVGWPACGETDILEMGNSKGIEYGTQDRYFNGACHWGQGWPQATHAKSTTKSYSLQDGEYHLYTLVWDENKIKMYVDMDKYPRNNPYFTLECPTDDPENAWSPGNYFHKDNFILFNLAVGGDFTGLHNPSEITALNEENDNMASMYINFVRIYQKDDVAHTHTFNDPGDEIPGSVDDIRYASHKISYDGHTLRSPRGEINLYSLEGGIIATTEYGEIPTDTLAPGVYLARDCSESRKILVR